METAPLISIITITFNAEKCILPTLESVYRQTYRNYEHIIIDGASTDGTLTEARKYPDLRILSERDKGLYDAMNKGLDMARGRYLLFLNAGDTFHSDKTLAAYAERARKGDDIIFGAAHNRSASSHGSAVADIRVVRTGDARVSPGIHGTQGACTAL